MDKILRDRREFAVDVRLLLIPVLAQVFPKNYQAEQFRPCEGREVLASLLCTP